MIAMLCSRLSHYSFAPLFGTQFWSTINGAKRHYPTGTGRHRASASPLVGPRGHCTQGLGPWVGAGRCFVWVCSRLSDYYVLTGMLWRGIDPARPLETAFPYARGVARRGVALAYVACWGCKAHLGGPTQAGLQGYLVSSVRCPQGVTAMDTRNGAFEIFDFSVDFYIFPLHVESDSTQCMQ